MHNKVICATLHRRPEATRRLLEAIDATYGVDGYTILLSVDRDDSIPACLEVADIAGEYTASNPKCTVWFHTPKLGIDRNKLFILDGGFKLSDYVIFLNDDTPISKDALLWFEWAGEKFKDDKSVYSVCGYNRVTDRTAADIDPYAYSFREGDGVWGFARWKDRHEESYGVGGSKYVEYCEQHGYPVDGWFDGYAYHIATKERNLYHVYPLLARSQHSEWECAEHTPKDDGGKWFMDNEYNAVWAGEAELGRAKDGWWHYEPGLPSLIRPLSIFIDCDSGGYNKPWYPGSFSGGSEEQTCLLAEQLSLAGHNVTVRNNCGVEREGMYSGVEYKHYEGCDVPEDLDVYCAFRNPHLINPRKAKVMVLLCHDIPHSSHFPNREEINNGWLDNTDIVMALNDYHKQLYIDWGCPEHKICVAPILMDHETYLQDVDRIPGRCVYVSCPDRGLREVLNYWPIVKQRVPHATLQICWNVPIVRDWFHYADGNEELGILPQKVLQHSDLAKELLQADVLSYYSTFAPEISPAATIKAQYAGAVPVVRCAGGMVDTVRFGWKTGDNDHWAHCVAEALLAPHWLEAVRAEMVSASQKRYNKTRAAYVWMSHVEDRLNDKN
jgi:hypothetical protein